MISNDTPIERPEDDLFGIDQFSKNIAKAIENLAAPEGTVIALTGAWGSGKSSAVNLIRHHLKSVEGQAKLEVIAFNPWWYSDEQTLTRAFFQHLYAGLGQAKSERARGVLLKLAKTLLSTGPLFSAPVNLLTFGFGGSLAEKAAATAADMIKVDRTAEEAYLDLSEELRDQNTRFLVIIDDIDRLTPDQALLVFRLVKSIGRLPNMTYLLVFDRDFAERVLTQQYPAERHFLEKIVQASFEIPPPDADILHDALLRSVISLVGQQQQCDQTRFRNVLIDAVNPLIALPRDLVRYVGNTSVAWAAIGKEVDLADLLAIEALRLFKFPVYQAIRSHKILLCGTGDAGHRHRQDEAYYDAVLLNSVSDPTEKDQLRKALRRLFPRLDSVWGNISYNSSARIWQAERRICDPTHFASYFNMALNKDVLPRKVLDTLFAHIHDPNYIKRFFLEKVATQRADGRTEVPIVLDELTASSNRIPSDAIDTFLEALFEIADQLDVPQDEQAAFEGNDLRLHWLLNPLVRDRLSQKERSSLFRRVLDRCSLGWAVSLISRIHNEHHPTQNESPNSPEERLTDEQTAQVLQTALVQRLREASQMGALMRLRHFVYILYRWRDLDSENAVRSYTLSNLSLDEFVLRIAEGLTSTAWITNPGLDDMGDRTSRPVLRVRLDGLDSILDVERFMARIAEIERTTLREDERTIIQRFREGLANSEAEYGGRRAARSGHMIDAAITTAAGDEAASDI